MLDAFRQGDEVAVLRYGLLGPVEVRTEAGVVRPRSRSQRLVLAVLLVDANRVVPAERLVEELWGDDLPDDPAGALRTQVSRLRRALGPAAADLITEEGGYRLRVERGALDAARFEDLVAEAAKGDGDDAVHLLDEALDLWRGAAVAEFADRPFAQPEAVRLEELRLAARERRAEALLSLGRAGEAAASLEALVAEHPRRERARGLLMEALYHLGRQADALDVYQSWRLHLGDELGLEPSPHLQRIEREILQHTLGAGGGGRAISERTRRLPLPVTSFVGREADLAAVSALLPQARLVTLWGPGGVGKTRLALEVVARVGDRYPDGVRFCDLAAVGRPGAVARAVATAVGLEERALRSLEDQLVEHLAHRHLLLVLDNCEHVVEAAAAVAGRLVRETGRVDVVSTSRERLCVDGEHLWPVAPLRATGADAPAVQLFVDRAGAVVPTVANEERHRSAISDICTRLDGLPLAIELAAGRLPGLTVPELARSLDQRFRLLTPGHGAHRRHRSLRAVVDWSYEQLPPVEQQVFQRLAVFAGRFDLDAARAVAVGDGVDEEEIAPAVLRLVDRSLLSPHREGDQTRYSLLETLRGYGLERLRERGQLDDARDRHARWAVELAERAARGLRGPDEAEWALTLRRSTDELRAAHGWLVGTTPELSLRLAAELHWYALWRVESEVFRWAEIAASAAAGTRSPSFPEALASAAIGAAYRGDLDGAEAGARSAFDAARGMGPGAVRRPLEALGEVALLRGDLERAASLYREAHELAMAAGDLFEAAWDICSVGVALAVAGRREEASAAATEASATAEASGSPSARALAAFLLGEIAATTDPEVAEEHLRRAVALAEPVGSRLVVGIAHLALATLYARHHDAPTALRYYEGVILEWQGAGAWTSQWVTLRTLVDLLARVGAVHDAAVLYGAVTSARTGGPAFGGDEQILRQVEARLREQLGDPGFRRSREEGEALADDEVIGRALEAIRRAARAGAGAVGT